MIDGAYAVVFPGQGSQSVGMLAEVSSNFSIIKETFTEASDVLHEDLWRLVTEGPVAQLDQTAYTQPALLAASYALWRILFPAFQTAPLGLAGHSLGEYSALVCAESLSFAEGIKLVHARGKFMQEAVPAGVGGMAAIVGLEDATVRAICREAVSAGEVLAPANFNSLGQVVIAGHRLAVLRAVELAKSQGAKLAAILAVSVPSHCELMAAAGERLALLLSEISFATPKYPIVNNVDAALYTDAASIREGLERQLSTPVRWVESIQKMRSAGVSRVIECGPGKVLLGLIKRIDKAIELISSADLASLNALLGEQTRVI